MEVWKEFEGNEITHSAAHYLMAIRDLSAKYGYARVSDVAEKLNITKGSASQSLKHLKTRGLVVEDDHRLLHLSDVGERIADTIAGRATVFKSFFAEALGVDENIAEIDACKIEHLISHSTSERLLQLMRFLKSEGEIQQQFLDEFRRSGQECSGVVATCPICETKCLAALEHEGVEADKNSAEAQGT